MIEYHQKGIIPALLPLTGSKLDSQALSNTTIYASTII
jgi:hypothetical protein